MKNLKKFLALGLAAAMTLSMAACGKGGNGGNGGNTASATNDDISIGTWWIQYYDSTQALEDAPTGSPTRMQRETVQRHWRPRHSTVKLHR